MPVGASIFTEHLWFVLTDQDANGKFLAANLTSFELYKDSTVVLSAGHPFITKKSVISYSDAKLFEEAAIDYLLAHGLALRKEPCDPNLLKVIRDGLLASNETPQELQDYLTLQLP